jgi:hypothetical protein
MDRAKPFAHVHLRRAADPDLGVGQVAGPRRGDSGPTRVLNFTGKSDRANWFGSRD